MKLATKAVDPRSVARSAQIELRKAQELLRALQWTYPPADAIKDARLYQGAWFGPKRCPICFVDWNRDEIHDSGCALGAALRRV